MIIIYRENHITITDLHFLAYLSTSIQTCITIFNIYLLSQLLFDMNTSMIFVILSRV